MMKSGCPLNGEACTISRLKLFSLLVMVVALSYYKTSWKKISSYPSEDVLRELGRSYKRQAVVTARSHVVP